MESIIIDAEINSLRDWPESKAACTSDLAYREQQNRPPNEDRIRGLI